MAYRLAISFTQETGDKVDNRTISEEFSDEAEIHLLKTQVFTDEITQCLNSITQRLTSMALDAQPDGGKGKK